MRGGERDGGKGVGERKAGVWEGRMAFGKKGRLGVAARRHFTVSRSKLTSRS